MREADLPAEPAEAQQEARISPADAHPRGTQRPEDAAPARPRPALRLIWRVRGHATFRDLARAPARRHGALSARMVPGDPDHPPSVAYALPRAVGRAVERNRLRRRLRALVLELHDDLAPGGRYLVSVGPAAMSTSPSELRAALRTVLMGATERSR
jgi:ribonuclease P protein component